jgi:hypothetical protein
VSAPQSSPGIDFGMSRLEQSLHHAGDRLVRVGRDQAAGADIAVSLASDGLGAEDFRTRRTLSGGKLHLELAGGGENGAMYGLLDVAEQLRLTGSLDKIPAAHGASAHGVSRHQVQPAMDVVPQGRSPSVAYGDGARFEFLAFFP